MTTGARIASLRARLPADWPFLLAVYGWVQLVLLAWWADEFPGWLSYDSTVYVTHVTTGPWTSEHSIVYDLLVKFSLQLCGTTWLLTLVQTVVWSATLMYFMRSVLAWGVRRRWAVIPVVVLPLVPSFGAVVSMVWKDVAFACAEVLLAATLLRLLREWPERSGTPWRRLAVVFAELLALLLFRNDGFLMIVPLTIVAVVVFRGLRLRLLAVNVAAVVAWLFVTAVLYPAAGIKGAKSSLSYGTFYDDIAVVYRWDPGSFSSADEAVMAKVAPLSSWRAGGVNCFDGDLLRATPGYRARSADRYRTDLAQVWFHILQRTPVATLKSRLCRGAIAWDPVALPWPQTDVRTFVAQQQPGYFGRADKLTAQMRRALRPRPLIGGLDHLARWARGNFNGRVWQVFVWRGATWCYLAYIALAVGAVRRRSWRLALVGGSVCLANQLMVMAANPAQLYRYMLGPLFLGMLLIPLAAAARAPVIPEPASPSETSPAPDEADPALRPVLVTDPPGD